MPSGTALELPVTSWGIIEDDTLALPFQVLP